MRAARKAGRSVKKLEAFEAAIVALHGRVLQEMEFVTVLLQEGVMGTSHLDRDELESHIGGLTTVISAIEEIHENNEMLRDAILEANRLLLPDRR